MKFHQKNQTKSKLFILKVPFRGDKGQTLIKSLENTLKRTIENKINYRIVHTGTKLSRYFSLKDKVNAQNTSATSYINICAEIENAMMITSARRADGKKNGKENTAEKIKNPKSLSML